MTNSTSSHAGLLRDLLAFVLEEQAAAEQKLLDIWARSISDKVKSGVSQRFARLERAEASGALWAYLGEGESRFREGDMLAIHSGSPMDAMLGRGLSLESEEDDRWLLRGNAARAVLEAYDGRVVYADPDAIDLTAYYRQCLDEIAVSRIGIDVVLPLLAGDLEIGFDDRDAADGERIALAEGLNARQAEAVAVAYGAEQVACIQGPPGTGKTRVLSLVVRLMVARGERVMMTSHTHMAINNALNKISAQGVPTVKIGRDTQRKGLDDGIPSCSTLGEWDRLPTDGYVVGATPFATCTRRLAGYEFDTIVFDEASQVTVPLALMAMRKGRRFIFVGDQKQLPPVMLSRSVLSKDSLSVFSALTSRHADHTVMLDQTYRMSRWLADWPSRTYYDGKLTAAGTNRERRLTLTHVTERLTQVFDPAASGVFIPTLDRSGTTRNHRDAELVAELCYAAVAGGLPLDRIGIVTPYRAQGRIVRDLLCRIFGRSEARKVIADTVERMQGQERELIVLSLATGDEVFLGAVAPFFFQPERLNVSITRAMTKLIVIGPALTTVPLVENGTIGKWIGDYVSLLRHLQRVDL